MTEPATDPDTTRRENQSANREAGDSDRIADLEARNADLRERVAELESIVADIAPGEGTNDSPRQEERTHDETADESTKRALPSGGQPRKVVGKFADQNGGVGVYGHNTASTGTTYGVWGEVNSPDGYGLFTPDTARIEGEIRSPSDLQLDPDDDEFRNIHLGGTTVLFYNPSASRDPLDQETVVGIGDAGFLYLNDGADIAFSDDFGLVETVQRTAGPVAKGYVNADGTVENTVNVSSVTWSSSSSWYEVSLTDDEYYYNEFATYVVSSSSAPGVTWGVGSTNGDLLVEPSDGQRHDFQFVTHKLIAGDSSAATSTTSSGSSTEP